MSPTSPTAHARPRRFLAVVFATALVIALAACTDAPTPTPTQYPAQPDFAPVLAPADVVATADVTSATLSARYTDEASPIDSEQILNAAQGGYGPMTNLRWFVDRLPQLSQMGIRQIRLDHLLNDSFYKIVTRQPDGTISYDFTRLDQVILGIVGQGMQPLMALSYTPSALGDDVNGVPSLPEWADAVAALVGHYRDLGYTGWDWEVWNEPDHLGWTAEQYLQLYATTAPAVKAADPTARVGGAAGAHILSPGGISWSFIQYAAAHRDVPVDFFSVHDYGTDDWGVADSARSMLDSVGLTIPVLITEWARNPTMTLGPGFGSDSNSSPTGPAYAAHRLSLAAQSSAERVFYFAPVEGFTYDMPYNGDLGLITVDGHRKSIGNVFDMYARLDDLRLPVAIEAENSDELALGGLVTRDSTSTAMTVMMWNSTSTDADVAVTLSDLPYADGNVRLVQRTISSTQGNGFADSSTVVMPSYPSPNENAPVTSDVVIEGASEVERHVTVPASGVVTVRLTATDDDAGTGSPSAEPSAINVAAAASGSSASASSSNEDAAAGWALAGAIDGRRYSVDLPASTVRGWRSQLRPNPQATESITVDLGTPTAIDSVSLWPYTTRSAASSAYPVEGAIRGSVDGSTWFPLAELRSAADGRVSGEQSYSFDPVLVRYLSVEATTLGAVIGADGRYAFALAELEAYRTGVPNSGFESADIAGWTATGDATVAEDVIHRGDRSARLEDGAAISTEIRGLRPSTTYTVGAYVHAGTDGGTTRLTVEPPVSAAHERSSSFQGWRHVWVTLTTGDAETSAVITVSSAGGGGWVDDVTVSQLAE